MKRLITATALCLCLAACATSGRLTTEQKVQLYRAHAGAAQNDMPFTSSLSGWQELGDSALAVWTRPGEAYLLELSGPCPDLPYAQAIGLTSRVGRVAARFDKVLVGGPGPGPQMPCFIARIRPLDIKALRVAEQDLRQAATQEREP